MIQKAGGWQCLECDECGDEANASFPDDQFADMIADAKAEGWSIRLVDGRWKHFCPACKDEPDESPLARAKRLFNR